MHHMCNEYVDMIVYATSSLIECLPQYLLRYNILAPLYFHARTHACTHTDSKPSWTPKHTLTGSFVNRACTCILVNVNVCVCMYVYRCTRINIPIQTDHVALRTQRYTSPQIHKHTHTHIYTYTRKNDSTARNLKFMHKGVPTIICIYMYIYTHTLRPCRTFGTGLHTWQTAAGDCRRSTKRRVRALRAPLCLPKQHRKTC